MSQAIMEPTYQQLAQRVMDVWDEKRASGQRRIIILLAGPPGSGKSTMAKHVVNRITSLRGSPSAVALSADGFHLPLSVLRKLPNASEALEKRGAPWTFDSDGVVKLVRNLRDCAGYKDLEAPAFDHATMDPVVGSLKIPRSIQICLVEGNYILTDQQPWDQISNLADDRWLIQVDQEVAFDRIVRRHLEAGIEIDLEAAKSRARNSDLVNGDYVTRHSRDSEQQYWLADGGEAGAA